MEESIQWIFLFVHAPAGARPQLDCAIRADDDGPVRRGTDRACDVALGKALPLFAIGLLYRRTGLDTLTHVLTLTKSTKE
jgi:hypothetical protein